MKGRFMLWGLWLWSFAALALTACGGSGSNKAAMATAAAAAPAAYETEAAAVAEEAFYLNLAENTGEEAGLTDTASSGQTLPPGRKLIRNVELHVETDSFDQLVKTLTAQAGELGGYVEESNISGNSINSYNEPIPRYASLTIRLPIKKIDGFIANVESSGNVTNKSESTQDVTLQYSDLESRKKSLSVEQDRMWALLEKADTLESVIALEERLSEIRYELEAMESQLRLYDNQVDYSTVYLYINEIKGAATFTPTAPESVSQRIQNGFNRNLNAMIQAVTGFLIWIITCSPFWLPLAVIGAAIASVVRIITQRKKKEDGKQEVKEENKDSQSKETEKE